MIYEKRLLNIDLAYLANCLNNGDFESSNFFMEIQRNNT